jgi:hypothetical protein
MDPSESWSIPETRFAWGPKGMGCSIFTNIALIRILDTEKVASTVKSKNEHFSRCSDNAYDQTP